MTNRHEEQVAGVTLFFKHSSLARAQAGEKFRVNLQLDCEVHDEGLWRTVESKFKDGFRVFTGADFHIEVMDIMRQEILKLEAKLVESARAMAREKDARAQLETELEKYRAPLVAFGQALRNGQ